VNLVIMWRGVAENPSQGDGGPNAALDAAILIQLGWGGFYLQSRTLPDSIVLHSFETYSPLSLIEYYCIPS
jgi:hypothetical protein